MNYLVYYETDHAFCSQVTENPFVWIGIAVSTALFLILAVFSWYCFHNRRPFFRFGMLKTPIRRFRENLSHNPMHNESLPALIKTFADFKPVMHANLMGLPRVFITNMEDLQVILRKEPERAANREALVPWLGQSLLTDGCTNFDEGPPDEGPYHCMVVDYLDIANKNSLVLVSQIQDGIQSGFTCVSSKIYLCVLDIMCEAGLGMNINAQRGGEPDYVQAVLALSQLTHKRQILSWLLRPCAFNLTPTGRKQNELLNRILRFSEKIILERFRVLGKERHNSGNPCERGEQKTCFLDMIMTGHIALTVKEIQDQLNHFIFSNHDKASASIIWALFELGRNQDVQELAYLEQRDIFRSSRRAVTADDLSNMTYLDRILKETFRLYPSTPIISRRLKSDVKIRGYNIPAGTDIPIFVYYIHRNPELYPNPEQFNPDRFLPDKRLDLRRESYTPLIFGPRFSFVEEFAVTKQKVILSHILRNFKFTSLDSRDIKLMGEFILRPRKSLRFRFEPRPRR